MRINQRGDTIIEVLFAFTVFSLIAVGGLSLMNQGTAMAQRALEIGLVRQQMDAQADGLRYLNRAYVADYGKGGEATTRWQQVVLANAVNAAAPFISVVENNRCNIPDSAFALDLTKIASQPLLLKPNQLNSDPATYAQVRYKQAGGTATTAEGIWIQAVRSRVVTGNNDGQERPGFYDFHIRACWETPGQLAPVTLGTIVRLYEPRG